jgi:hypothetical protein
MEITSFTASDWLSPYGWNADGKLSLTSANVKSFVQNLLVKTGSRSLKIELGIPCSHTMPSKNAHVMNVTV